MKPMTIIAICVICAATLMSGCIEPTNGDIDGWIEDRSAVEQIQMIHTATPTPAPTPEPAQIELIIESYMCEREYKINTKTGNEVYVCSHFGCDMAQALLNGGYDAGVVHDNTVHHIATWINLDGVRYVIEPQNGDYWISDEYNPSHNLDYASISKGREFAKQSTEGLHT